MTVLVVHASRYGSTEEIAERIGEILRAQGREVDVRPADSEISAGSYDAFVVGSAAYMGGWEKSATQFVLDHQDLLAARPVWLFSSGPLGSERTNADGGDVVVDTRPRQWAQLEPMVTPRSTRVFFGALRPERLSLTHRLARKLPAGRSLLPEGDFRDWDEVEAWARDIHAALPPEYSGREKD